LDKLPYTLEGVCSSSSARESSSSSSSIESSFDLFFFSKRLKSSSSMSVLFSLLISVFSKLSSASPILMGLIVLLVVSSPSDLMNGSLISYMRFFIRCNISVVPGSALSIEWFLLQHPPLVILVSNRIVS